ncbi:hypothetical protein ABPG75_003114 [Micractinium tetrahymenae]
MSALHGLASPTALTLLDLADCGLAQVPAELRQLGALKHLDLTENCLEEEGWQRLAGLTCLTSLSLASTGLEAVPAEVAGPGHLGS